MNTRILSLAVTSCLLAVTTHAAVSINVAIGRLRSSEAATLPSGTLWALISENNSGNLPGGLLVDDSLYNNHDTQSIVNDFAGNTIAIGEIIGGGTVIGVGSTTSDSLIDSIVDFTASDYGLSQGDKLGVYWFPGRTISTNTLPVNSFEIGGFHRTTVSPESFGNAGLVIPADEASLVTASYYDSTSVSGTGIAPTEFQAIAVPEPSAMLLICASLIYLIRRKK